MAQKTLVTQGELKPIITGLGALADNLDEHVNESFSKAHGWSLLNSPYLDSGGLYHTDFGQSGLVAIPGVFNTGVNSDGTLASPASVDAHWTLVQSPDPLYTGPSAFVGSPRPTVWSSNGPLSQWLSPASDGTKFVKLGSYKYRLTFNLSGLNPASAVIKGKWVSDNQTTNVLLNGVVTGLTGVSNPQKQPSAGTSFIISSGFVTGVNTLDFLVTNTGRQGGIRVEISGVASAGGVFAIPGVFSTGVDASGIALPTNSTDPHWTLTQSPDVTNPGPNAFLNVIPAPWVRNTARAAWISPRKTGPSNIGTYIYSLTFDLTGFSAGTAIIKGSFSADDTVTDVRLNGVSTGIVKAFPAFNTTTGFVISSGFSAGLNTLEFVVKNTGGYGGLRADISGTAGNAGSGLAAYVLRLNVGGNVFYIPCQLSGGLDGEVDPEIPVFTGIVSPQSADPATDLTVGSPTTAELVTTFAALLNATSVAASDTLLQHAGSPAEEAHSGLSWQAASVVTSAGYIAGRRTLNILIGGVQYRIVGDTNTNGPIN